MGHGYNWNSWPSTGLEVTLILVLFFGLALVLTAGAIDTDMGAAGCSATVVHDNGDNVYFNQGQVEDGSLYVDLDVEYVKYDCGDDIYVEGVNATDHPAYDGGWKGLLG